MQMWNSLEQVLKYCTNIKPFKNVLYKNTLLKGYVVKRGDCECGL